MGQAANMSATPILFVLSGEATWHPSCKQPSPLSISLQTVVNHSFPHPWFSHPRTILTTTTSCHLDLHSCPGSVTSNGLAVGNMYTARARTTRSFILSSCCCCMLLREILNCKWRSVRVNINNLQSVFIIMNIQHSHHFTDREWITLV